MLNIVSCGSKWFLLLCVISYHRISGSKYQSSAVGFFGDGWAFPTSWGILDPKLSNLSVQVSSHDESGLILYCGPLSRDKTLYGRSFIALDVNEGYASLYVDYGVRTAKISQKIHNLTNGEFHTITVQFKKDKVWMQVDDDTFHSLTIAANPGLAFQEYYRVGGPIQVGGSVSNFKNLASYFQWNETPSSRGFSGCIQNLTIDGKIFKFAVPDDGHNADLGCKNGYPRKSFDIKTILYVAIIVCLSIVGIKVFAPGKISRCCSYVFTGLFGKYNSKVHSKNFEKQSLL